jgi:hypothetical protein
MAGGADRGGATVTPHIGAFSLIGTDLQGFVALISYRMIDG